MFLFYTVFYAAFVAINLISPSTMATIVVAGLNLATVFGMGLIVLALVQALIYNVMCSRKEAEFARWRPRPALTRGDRRMTPTRGSGPASDES